MPITITENGNTISTQEFEFQLMKNNSVSLCNLQEIKDQEFYYEEFDKETFSDLINNLIIIKNKLV